MKDPVARVEYLLEIEAVIEKTAAFRSASFNLGKFHARDRMLSSCGTRHSFRSWRFNNEKLLRFFLLRHKLSYAASSSTARTAAAHFHPKLDAGSKHGKNNPWQVRCLL